MAGRASIAWKAIRPRPPAHVRDDHSVLRAAFERFPALADILHNAARADEPILLLLNDSHRATRTRLVLEALATVNATLAVRPRFSALVATGTHRFSVFEQRNFERLTIDRCGLRIDSLNWHDGADAAGLADCAGLRINRTVAASRAIIAIGSVEPHYFAGLTGAHKTATIGVLARELIERNHAGALEPASDVFALRGNPVHDGIERMLADLRSAGKTIVCVDHVLSGDRIVAAAAGDPIDTLFELAPAARDVYAHRIDGPVDVLRLRVPMPLGRSFYQADKALKNNQGAVRDGGAILLEADCPEGIGPDAFMGLLRRANTYAQACRIVAAEGYRLSDHKAVKLRHLTDPAARGVRVALVSSHVQECDAAVAGMRVFGNAETALDWLTEAGAAPLRRGLIIDDAGVVCVTPVQHAAQPQA
jgi:nickel-dependent lactate racemase